MWRKFCRAVSGGVTQAPSPAPAPAVLIFLKYEVLIHWGLTELALVVFVMRRQSSLLPAGHWQKPQDAYRRLESTRATLQQSERGHLFPIFNLYSEGMQPSLDPTAGKRR